MNIAFFSDSVSSHLSYGNAVRSCNIARALSKEGHNVYFVCSRYDPHENLLQDTNVTVVYLDIRIGIGSLLVGVIKLSRIIDASDLCLLCLFWDFSHILFYVFDFFLNSKFFLMPNGALPPYGRSLFPKKLYMLLIGNALLQRSSSLLAVTHLESRQIRNFYRLSKTSVLPNGLEVSCLDPFLSGSTAFSQAPFHDQFCITYLGRLSSEKGVDLLIQAYGSLIHKYPKSQTTLVIAGPDFGAKDDLKRLVANLKLPKPSIRFIGPISGQQKLDFYRSSSLHVVPSRHEAMSMVALEAAFYSNCPVVATYECGLHEFECLSESFIFCEATALSLFSAIASVYEYSGTDLYEASVKRICDQRRSVIRDRFSWDAVARELLAKF
jgi:glycosyltransferase involved in cell wall biosynthesis